MVHRPLPPSKHLLLCYIMHTDEEQQQGGQPSHAQSWSLQGIALPWLRLVGLVLSVTAGALERGQSPFSAVGWGCHTQRGIFSHSPSNLVPQLGCPSLPLLR